MLADAHDQSYAEVLGDGNAIGVWREVLKLSIGRSEHTAAAVGMAAIEKICRMLPESIAPLADLAKEGKRLKHDLNQQLGSNAVLLYPPFSRTAPQHNRSLLNPMDVAYTAIFNALEFPASVVPIEFDADGLPVAIQIVGGSFQDRLTLRVSRAVEDSTGGWARAEPSPQQKRPSMIQEANFRRNLGIFHVRQSRICHENPVPSPGRSSCIVREV